MTARELTRLFLIQTSVLVLSAGIFAAPVGVLRGDRLIQVVDLRPFGSTMKLHVPIGAPLSGLVLLWNLAFLAGLYPAIRAGRFAPPRPHGRSESPAHPQGRNPGIGTIETE